VHITAVLSSGHRSLVEGQAVEFEIVIGENGRRHVTSLFFPESSSHGAG